jgi:hypothetical protein
MPGKNIENLQLQERYCFRFISSGWYGVLAGKHLQTLRTTAVPLSSGSASEDEGVTLQETWNLPPQPISTAPAHVEQYNPLLHRH